MSLKEKLESFLVNCEKLVVLGIGNELRGDDSIGPYIIKELENMSMGSNSSDNSNTKTSDKKFNRNIIFIDGGSAPENFTGLIKKENPSHLLIIDAALMGTNPSNVKTIVKDELPNINASTHSMSLSYLIKYLEVDIYFDFLLIGIEPVSMNLGEEISHNVLKSADEVIDILSSLLFD
ncbi:hydrogenase maturation peptidase HycI [Methanobrevibacter arboriphilus]|uniref:hydrogenase maturation peptidase HycI n=1 Tax=Methanobrevibacter arboriphilus TaxID=39441 RepID=UPI0009E924A0|nr:hydrogenase maturation peptidase HycI [Methanobrevibacter arboriphilus]